MIPEEPMNKEESVKEAHKKILEMDISYLDGLEKVLEKLWERGYDYGCYVNY